MLRGAGIPLLDLMGFTYVLWIPGFQRFIKIPPSYMSVFSPWNARRHKLFWTRENTDSLLVPTPLGCSIFSKRWPSGLFYWSQTYQKINCMFCGRYWYHTTKISLMFAGRYWSHIQDFQKNVRRIFIIVRCSPFLNLSKMWVSKVLTFIKIRFWKMFLDCSWFSFRYPGVSKDNIVGLGKKEPVQKSRIIEMIISGSPISKSESHKFKLKQNNMMEFLSISFHKLIIKMIQQSQKKNAALSLHG